MSAYQGRYAELYDLFYAEKSYDQEVDFIDQCFREYDVTPPARILELACGTGNHSLLLAQRGYQILATDYSTDMIAVASRKRDGMELSVEFRQQDMAALDIPAAPFDAVLCMFDSIGYLVTNEAISRTLQNIYRHLRVGGLFLVEFWHAPPMLRDFDPVRVRRWTLPDKEILRISETSLNIAQQTAQVKYSVYELGTDGTYSMLCETHSNRYFFVPEMDSYLTSAGFTPLRWFAGPLRDEQITEDTWHVVCLARRD